MRCASVGCSLGLVLASFKFAAPRSSFLSTWSSQDSRLLPNLIDREMQASAQNPNNDVLVPNSPNDTVSQLLFSPTSNFLCASSWNKEVAVYDVQGNGSTALKGKLGHSHPILCCDWSPDGAQIVNGSSDNQARVWNLATNQEIVVGQHQAAIKAINFVKELNLIVTGSFDKTIKYCQ